METIWPTSVGGWIGVITGFLVILGALWAVLKYLLKDPLLKELKGLGDRTNELELNDARQETRINRVEADLRVANTERRNIMSQLGELKSSVTELDNSVRNSRTEILAAVHELGQSVAELRGRMGRDEGVR